MVLKDKLDRERYRVQLQEKHFSEAVSLLKNVKEQAIIQKTSELVKNKQRMEKNASNNIGDVGLSNLLQTKEKLQANLEQAHTEIAHLKTLVADNTLQTLHTVYDDDYQQSKTVT